MENKQFDAFFERMMSNPATAKAFRKSQRRSRREVFIRRILHMFPGDNHMWQYRWGDDYGTCLFCPETRTAEELGMGADDD